MEMKVRTTWAEWLELIPKLRIKLVADHIKMSPYQLALIHHKFAISVNREKKNILNFVFMKSSKNRDVTWKRYVSVGTAKQEPKHKKLQITNETHKKKTLWARSY